MRIVLSLCVAVALVGCAPKPDPKICTPLPEMAEPIQANEIGSQGTNLETQRLRAEACVQRAAYRLAVSDDPAETVAKAAVESCDPVAGNAADLFGSEEIRRFGVTPDTLVVMTERSHRRAAEARASYESLALRYVVEGRAGHCADR